MLEPLVVLNMITNRVSYYFSRSWEDQLDHMMDFTMEAILKYRVDWRPDSGGCDPV